MKLDTDQFPFSVVEIK
jgi:hypothetical protein